MPIDDYIVVYIVNIDPFGYMLKAYFGKVGLFHLKFFLDYNDAKVAILVQFKCPNVLSLCSDKLHEE